MLYAAEGQVDKVNLQTLVPTARRPPFEWRKQVRRS